MHNLDFKEWIAVLEVLLANILGPVYNGTTLHCCSTAGRACWLQESTDIQGLGNEGSSAVSSR